MTLSTEQGFPHWLMVGTFLRGWALAAQGQEADGIAQMQQAVAARRSAGAELARSFWLPLLAEAYGSMEQAEEGLSLMAEALDVVVTTGERWYEAELHRLRGELLQHAAGHEAEAEACLHQAIAVARRQQASSLELRAAMSLSRLWQRQGKRAAARQLLAEVYDWFTEGFDTPDLQDARALLNALA